MLQNPVLARRRCVSTLALVSAALTSGCQDSPGPAPPDEETIAKLTITARPSAPSQGATVGYTQLNLATARDGYVYVPPSYASATPAPLLVLLHGASGSATDWTSAMMQSLADAHGVVIVATDSRYTTWDLPQTGFYDVDVAFLNSALQFVFDRVNVDPARVVIGGFSDGASEALGIGIANAGLFRKIIAFTPGQLRAPFSRGAPEIFVSHGLDDEVISQGTVNNIVARLRQNGMTVQYLTFLGSHEIPDSILMAAFDWMRDL